MSYETFKSEQIIESVDIPTMGEMSADEYEEYLRTRLLLVDHHDVLRSGLAGYPIAVTKAQIRALLEYLKEMEPRIGEQ